MQCKALTCCWLCERKEGGHEGRNVADLRAWKRPGNTFSPIDSRKEPRPADIPEVAQGRSLRSVSDFHPTTLEDNTFVLLKPLNLQ